MNTKKLFILIFTSLFFTDLSHALDVEKIYSHLLTKYYQDQANSDVERVLGSSPFFVKANVKLNAKLIKKEKETNNPIKLPLSKMTLDEREFKKLSADSFGPVTLHELLSLVDSAKLSITVEPELKESIKQLIRTQIFENLKISSITEQDIQFEDGPAEWAQYRKLKEQKIVEISESNSGGRLSKNSPLFSVGFLAVIAAALFAMMFSIRAVAREIRDYAAKLISAVKETAEMNPMPQIQRAEPIQTNEFKNSNRHTPSEHDDFWDKVDLSVVATFIHDVCYQPQWRGIVDSIMNQALSAERSSQLEKLIGEYDSLSEPSSDSEKTSQLLHEAAQFIQAHQAEYRRINRSPLGQLASHLKADELKALSDAINAYEKAILINSLPPLSKDGFVQSLSVESRLEIVKTGEMQIPTSEMKAYELSLTLALEKIAANHTRGSSEQKTVKMAYLTQGVLKSKTFEEDESIYLKSKELGFNYQGVLGMLDSLDTRQWAQMNLSDLALATFGYSDITLQRFKDKLEGKRVQWFDNFLKKAKDSHYTYGSKEAYLARERLSQFVTTATSEKDEIKTA